MPIKFRCPNCSQFLGISRQSAGTIVDCPACGRTLRVPYEDGRVDPLPAAKLDLQDESILQALEQIASVEPSLPGKAPVILDRSESPQVPLEPAPAPIPVSFEPPPFHDSPTTAGSPVDVQSALAALAAESSASVKASTIPPRRSGVSRRDMLVATGAALLSWPLGWWMGRRPARRIESARIAENSRSTPAPDRSEKAMPAESSETAPALHGRITYIGTDGEARPDAGARILALPEVRSGTSKLAVDGFRPGASEADVQLARESLRMIGGAFATADTEGRYQLDLTSPGAYRLLVISRYQPRNDQSEPPVDTSRLLDAYFDRPALLIGALRYDVSRFRYSGRESAPRDHVFART